MSPIGGLLQESFYIRTRRERRRSSISDSFSEFIFLTPVSGTLRCGARCGDSDFYLHAQFDHTVCRQTKERGRALCISR